MRLDSLTLAGLVLFVISVTLATSKCLDHDTDVKAKRHFFYKGKNLPIVIEASNRVSHKLSSAILQILLKEYLGYQKVEVRHLPENSMNVTEGLHRLTGCADSRCYGVAEDYVPDSMVNLEMWLPAGFNVEEWTLSQKLLDGGPLGPSGRLGWYMPSQFVDDMWNTTHFIMDHWRALQTEQVAAMFSMERKTLFLKEWLTLDIETPGVGKHYCEGSDCDKGIYTSNQCQDPHKCAVLVTSYPELDMGTLKEQISRLKLDVNVAWIGSHLPEFVKQRTLSKLPTLFFNWIPNTLTSTNNYTRVKFPTCAPGHDEHSDNCDFEIHQLNKMAWSRLKTHTPEAYHLITSMFFSQSQYDQLLRSYVQNSQYLGVNGPNIDATACRWVKDNAHIWKKWLPGNLSQKSKIYIGGMFPITGPYLRSPGIIPGAIMAQDFINSNPAVLGDYQLEILIQDTKCQSDEVMKKFINYLVNDTHPVVGILGPACSETAEPIAGVSKHFNKVIMSYRADALALADRKKYPYFFRTVPQISQNMDVYLEIFKIFNWHQVALLSQEGDDFSDYHTSLQEMFMSHHINVLYKNKLKGTHTDVAKHLEEIKKKKVRIIIGDFFEDTARDVMCEAFRQGMTIANGFQWFLPPWFTRQWWNTDWFNQFSVYLSTHKVECATEQMLQAVLGHMSLASAFFAAEDYHIIGNMTVGQWQQRYNDIISEKGYEESGYAAYAYDAVWVYALSLNSLLAEDPSALESLSTRETVKKFMWHLNQTQFNGVSGPIKFIGADRKGIIDIYQFHSNYSVLIDQYMPAKNMTHLKMNSPKLRWFTQTGQPPEDGSNMQESTCAVEGFRALLGVDCDMAVVIANLLGVGSFCILMLIALIIVKKRYDHKVRATHKRMEELGLLQNSGLLNLDEWEMPRDKVVLNRKLGQGAFGTVYGGEAQVEGRWLAVAVKTLKVGSNPEMKLDFLSEAELMKGFDHANIVKLMGVCTRGEPAYMIMEFMLHGDLKTFLLSRRHLAQQRDKEAEDVSPQNLTRMARDIAMGLQYLGNLKYVHRDLACRNCLVHSSKTVKIGDFGMTRHMYDSDYYRFNKRGMLPVRWMAPESLSDGLFTQHSDIWSFGIMLYEVITFGSFPYQGLSNKQVMEYVKCGSTITLPESCNATIKRLLQQCWTFEPKSRPSISYILDVMHEHGSLLTPCLDTPMSAVYIDTKGSLQMAVPMSASHYSSTQTVDELPVLNSPSINSVQMDGAPGSPLDPYLPERLRGRLTDTLGQTPASSRYSSTSSVSPSVNLPSLENLDVESHAKQWMNTMQGFSKRYTGGPLDRLDLAMSSAGSVLSNSSSPLSLHQNRLFLGSEERQDSDYESQNSQKEQFTEV